MTLKAPARMPSVRLRAFMSEAPRQSQPRAAEIACFRTSNDENDEIAIVSSP
jgi:hypothetical protein